MISAEHAPPPTWCPQCGSNLGQYPAAVHCPFCGVALAPRPPSVPAPYLRRMAALAVDWAIVVALVGPVGLWIASLDDPNATEAAVWVVIHLVIYVVSPLYWALLSRIWDGRTVGRRLVGLQLVRDDGSGVGYLRTLGRAVLSGLFAIFVVPAAIDLLLPAVGRRRRSIADRATDTLVAIRPETGR